MDASQIPELNGLQRERVYFGATVVQVSIHDWAFESVTRQQLMTEHWASCSPHVWDVKRDGKRLLSEHPLQGCTPPPRVLNLLTRSYLSRFSPPSKRAKVETSH